MYNCTCMIVVMYMYMYVHVCMIVVMYMYMHVHMCDCSHIKFHWCMYALATVQSQYRRKKLTCTAITCDLSFEKEDFPEK